MNTFATYSVVKMTYSKVFPAAILYLALWKCAEVSSDLTILNQNRTSPEGCGECAYYRCPEAPSKCLLGSLSDPCECCPAGRCAKLDGEACWNSSIPELPRKSRKNGFCAPNYICQLRNDLLDEDEPEAVCVCIEQSPACGSNSETYSTPCALHEEAMNKKNLFLKLQHLGPCPSRPWITSPLEDIFVTVGQRVALNCEVKGFPVPDIFWEFHSADRSIVLKLPNDEYEDTVVNVSDDPENLIRSSWLQVASFTKKYSGIYQCIANNTIGGASTTASVIIV